MEQANRALFSLYRTIRNLDLAIKRMPVKTFDNTIVLVLTYGCEIRGFGDLSAIEMVHSGFFLKRILKVKKSTPTVMLYGDLGRVPLSIGIKKRAVGFWYDMILRKTYMSCVRAYVRALACVCACARMYLCVCVFVYSICINYYIIYVVFHTAWYT